MTNERRRERSAQELGTRELFAVVRGRSRAVEPTEALRELLERDPSRTALLTDIVVEPERPADLRAAAAVALGRNRKPSHQRVLIDALAAREPIVVRRAAEALGKIGDESALAELERVRAGAGPVRRSVVFARTLISYRLGLDRHRLEPPPRRAQLEVQPRRATRLEPRPPTRRALPGIMEDAQRELPAVPLSERGARRFSCGDSDFVLLLSRELERSGGLGSLTRKSAVMGAILEKSPSTDSFFLYEYLLSDPAANAPVRLYGVRGTGIVCHFGELRVDGPATFEVRALNTPFSPPIDIQGSYDASRMQLTFSRALVHRDFEAAQPQPAEPAKLEFRVD